MTPETTQNCTIDQMLDQALSNSEGQKFLLIDELHGHFGRLVESHDSKTSSEPEAREIVRVEARRLVSFCLGNIEPNSPIDDVITAACKASELSVYKGLALLLGVPSSTIQLALSSYMEGMDTEPIGLSGLQRLIQ